MGNNLILEYKQIEHPYRAEPGAAFETWVELRIRVVDEAQATVKCLLDTQWDIIPFLRWCQEQRNHILNTHLPFDETRYTSIAEALYSELDKADVEDEAFLDALYLYRSSHSLRFAMRGTDIPDIYLGKFGEDYQVSCYEEGKENCWFNVDLPKFLKDVDSAADLLDID